MRKGVINYVRDFFWKEEQKASRTQVLLSGGSGSAIWSDKDYASFSKEAYLRNAVAFTCITRIAQAASTVPWWVYEIRPDGKRVKVNTHELLTLIRRANPFDSFNFLILKAVAYLLLCGNSYFEIVRSFVKSGASEIYVLRPDYMQVRKDESTGGLAGYVYSVNGRSINFDVGLDGTCDVLQLKIFHPTDDWYGAAPTSSAGYEIDTDNERSNWNKKLLQNEARPGMIYTVAGNLTDPQFARLKKQLDEGHSGGDNAGKTLILEGTTDAKPYGWSPEDLEFIEGGRELARKQAMVYGYPPMLLGIPGDNTYSNYQEARLALYEDTVSFYLNYIKAELNNWLLKNDETIVIDYDLSEVPALASRRKEQYETADKVSFLKVNEKREMVGRESLGPVGDVILVQASMIPLGEDPNMDEGTQDEGTQDEGTQE